jgi:FtsH-binding integral membrane protein
MSHHELDLRPVVHLDDTTRGDFVVRVYQHLLGAIVAFVAIEALFLNTPVAERIYDFVGGGGPRWLLILGAFMVGQWIVTQAAVDLLNPQRQYAALFGSAALYALLFAPLLHYFFRIAEDGATSVAAAGLITAMAFAGLTVVAFVTRADLSFIRPIVMYGFVVALVLIVAAVLFGFSLGIWFSVAMIALSGAAILYQTQAIIREFPAQAHVAAALALFASVMTLFWYVLRLVGALRD